MGEPSTSPASNCQPPVAILGIPFDNITQAQALLRIETMIGSRKPHYLVTANVDFLVQARVDVELRRILCEADLVLCDGTPVLWVSRALGNPLAERVAGSDLVPFLLRAAEEKHWRVFFLGASPEACASAVARLQARHPQLVIAGHFSPKFAPLLDLDHAAICQTVRAAKPDLLFVSFGCPKQEKWIAMHYRTLGVPVTVGVGATIDFLAGKVRRAPPWMRRSGTEWLFRLAQEPRRLFSRYFKGFWLFGCAAGRQWWRLGRHRLLTPRWRGRKGREWYPRYENAAGTDALDYSIMETPVRLDAASPGDWVNPVVGPSGVKQAMMVDLSSTTFIDSTGVGCLIGLRKRVLASGSQLILVGARPQVVRALKLLRVDELFAVARDFDEARRWLRNWQTNSRSGVASVTGQHHTVAWHGEITSAGADAFWLATSAAFRDCPGPGNDWIVDLTQVRFIDSTGLGLMLKLRKFAHSHGARLRFDHVQPAVRNVIKLAHLEELLLRPAGEDRVAGVN